MKKIFLSLFFVILGFSAFLVNAAIVVQENLAIPDTQEIGVGFFRFAIEYGAYPVPLVPKDDSERVIVPNAILTLKEAYIKSQEVIIGWASDAKLAGIRSIGSITLDGRSSMWQIAYGSHFKKKGYEIIIHGDSMVSQKELLWMGGDNYDYGYNIPANWYDSEGVIRALQELPQFSDATASSINLYYNTDGNIWRYFLSTSRGITSMSVGPALISGNFWSEVQNAPNWLRLRITPGVIGKSENDILKTLPNKWALKILSATDANGNNMDTDGYRWYQIEDKTDGAIGWMAAKNLSDGIVYLDYNSNNQNELQNKSETQLDTTDKRKQIILDAINNYHTKDNSDNSIYGGGGGLDGLNNFQKFITGSGFPKELTLAIASQESGGVDFDNERCSYMKDGGIGIMQITSSGYKGLGSSLDNKPHKNDCTASWIGNLSKYYSNALQGIYANIKDSFRVLQDKYRQKCPKADEIIDGYTFTCQDMEKILNTWAYNGFIKDKNGDYIWHYLWNVADKLERLSDYFSGIFYNNADNFIEKLKIADANKQIIKVYSPVELRVIDAQGNITGVVNGQTKEEIKDSLYESEQETVAVFFPENNYKYRLVGKDNGSYGLLVNNEQSGIDSKFTARNIPIKAKEIHQYEIDWNKMISCEQSAVKLKIDFEGDGIFDRTIYSDCDLYDIEQPQISILPLQSEYVLNSQIQIQFSATDNISGVASITAALNGSETTNNQTIILNKPGVNILKVTAIDNEGNGAILETTFNVLYNLGNFLPPIKVDGSGVYNFGRTLPVKFQLTDISGNFISIAAAHLYVAKISSGIAGNNEIPLSTSAVDTGNIFRYDSINNQYIYNLSTDVFIPGTWQLKVVLDSGQVFTNIISVR